MLQAGSWLAHGLGEDGIGGLDPDEGTGALVPLAGEGLDHGDELLDAAGAASPDGLRGEDAEPRLDLGANEVIAKSESWMAPALPPSGSRGSSEPV
jgi:hypothetical protein